VGYGTFVLQVLARRLRRTDDELVELVSGDVAAALNAAAQKASSLPTTSLTQFKTAAYALGLQVKNSMGDISQSVGSLKSAKLQAAAKKVPACTSLS
jgi:hypothetical protein